MAKHLDTAIAAAHERVRHADRERRLVRLLYCFLWREVTASADRSPRELRTIRWARHALPERYRKAAPRTNNS